MPPKSETATTTSTATTGAAAAGNSKRVAPEITAVVGGITMPTAPKRAGSNSPYPFDGLEIGQAFGVKNKTAKGLASIVSNQNRKHKVEKKDANGNPVFKTTEMKASDGTVTRIPTSEKEMVDGKTFFAVDVVSGSDVEKQIKGTALEGSSVLVFRKA